MSKFDDFRVGDLVRANFSGFGAGNVDGVVARIRPGHLVIRVEGYANDTWIERGEIDDNPALVTFRPIKESEKQ